MKLTYHCCGDYLLPDLTIPDEPVVLGKYGSKIEIRYNGPDLCVQ